MSKRSTLLLSAFAFLLMGCERSATLDVRVTNAGPEGGSIGLREVPVRLLPYDRDSIFDALEAQAEQPEPEIPEDLLQLRDSVSEAQAAWREAEADWNETRSELQTLANELQQLDRSSDAYFEGFDRFEELESVETRLSGEKDELFERFTELQNRYALRADSIGAVRATWADRAFEDFGEIVDSILETRGREEYWDTTDASGWVRLQAPAGRWWVYTRSSLPYQELYWNVPVDVGEADTLVLDTANAEYRSLF